MFEFHQDRLKLKEKLGKGRFGAVFPYQKHSEDLKWVVKRIKADDADALVASLPEVILGMSCDQANIVPIKGYFIEKNDDNEGYNIYTKLPRMKGALLDDFKERKASESPYTEEEIIRHFYSLVSGVEYLHKKKIFHGDIKPESLLLDHNGVLKIADIGVSKHLIEEKAVSKSQIINYQYSAPEILGVEIKKEMLKKADIWSLGVVILELCYFDLKLFNASLPKDQLQNRLDELFESLKGKYNQKVLEILQMVLSLNPEERPDAELVRRELVKSFPEILDEKSENHIGISDEQKQEIFGRYEAEIKHLKGVISQFEAELMKKSEVKTPAKSTTTGGEEIEEETKVNDFEEQIRKLQEEKLMISQKLDESKIAENLENQKLQQSVRFLEAKLKEIEAKPKIEGRKRESQGEMYKENLQAVVSKLNGKWNKWYKGASFECKVVEDKFLQIRTPEKSTTDESLSKFSKDLLPTLKENDLLNLQGITFYSSAPLVTDKSISDFIFMLSNQSLKLQHLVIYVTYCKGITDKSIEDLAKALAVHLPHLNHLRLLFNESPKLTDKSLEHLAEVLSNGAPNLSYLELSFEGVKGMTDIGYEALATAVENGVCVSQKISYLKLIFPRSGVTSEKKAQAKKRFEKISYLDIR